MNITAAVSIALIAANVMAEGTTFTSTRARTSLIELYTSEGCSSCPPAERKLNDLASHKGLWTDFVPIAFHVDYWNYIGWTDRYSSPAFTARQRAYSSEWTARNIYTPCFVVNGAETRRLSTDQRKGKAGRLKVRLNGDTAHIAYEVAKTQDGPLIAWLAPLSGPESSNVTSGENRGRKLHHNFVALGLKQQAMNADSGVYRAQVPFTMHPKTKAIAVWVSLPQSLKPIQATGGWLKP